MCASGFPGSRRGASSTSARAPGELSKLLLAAGWHGVGYEPGPAADRVQRRNAAAIAAGRYDVRAADWLVAPPDRPADLVASSMVIEHLPLRRRPATSRVRDRRCAPAGAR
ncbi:MAG: hypothetical protein ACR2LK_04070 [Solirubrobacteraceae bacterium]